MQIENKIDNTDIRIELDDQSMLQNKKRKKKKKQFKL